MITREQADQAGKGLLEQPQAELGERQDKLAKQAAAAQRRCESPLIPALTAAVTTVAALGFVENTAVCVMLGAAVGGLFGWAARRSQKGSTRNRASTNN